MDTPTQPTPATGASPSGGQKKTAKMIIIAVVVLVLGFIAIGAATVFMGFKTFSGPSDAAKAWVQEVATGDMEMAYESTNQEFKDIGTGEEFEEYIQEIPVFTDFDEVKFSQFSIEGNQAVVSGTITGGGTDSPITIRLVKEDGEWKVAAFSLDEADVPEINDDEEDDF